MADNNIVLGIFMSDAALITENAFRSVLGMDDDDLTRLSPDDKFGRYCNQEFLELILDYVQVDGGGGLPSMTPPRQIDVRALEGIGLGSLIRLLISRLSEFAFYLVPKKKNK